MARALPSHQHAGHPLWVAIQRDLTCVTFLAGLCPLMTQQGFTKQLNGPNRSQLLEAPSSPQLFTARRGFPGPSFSTPTCTDPPQSRAGPPFTTARPDHLGRPFATREPPGPRGALPTASPTGEARLKRGPAAHRRPPHGYGYWLQLLSPGPAQRCGPEGSAGPALREARGGERRGRPWPRPAPPLPRSYWLGPPHPAPPRSAGGWPLWPSRGLRPSPPAGGAARAA